MIRADIVIGANFGDEGKGLITDFYAAQKTAACLVVRHNGGAQAGHTVTLANGKRHVFSHFGAGSFAGAATYLSRFFVCNPLLFRREREILNGLCPLPPIHADKNAIVTTPYDMLINQIVEEARGDKRHGSCGAGFGETIERNTHPAYALTVGDMNDLPGFLQKLVSIRMEWLPKRLVALGVHKVQQHWLDRLASDDMLADYVDATGYFLRHVRQTAGMPLKGIQHVVCEGAQGLLLDQEHAWFPHVTRSYTGVRNAAIVLAEAGITAARATYITRSYLTRHGAGPMPHELAEKPYQTIVDATNFTNAHQGHLRFALLDIDAVANAIGQDLLNVPAGFTIEAGLAITCVDQIDGPARYIQNGAEQHSSTETFMAALYRATNAAFGLASYGPTRRNVRLTGPGVCHTLRATG